jgi:hypothetical protein
MAWGRVLLQLGCITAACAVPWCDNFKRASEFSFICRRVSDPAFENNQACEIWSNWGNKNLAEEQYTTAPPGPMRWMCPPDARPMPRMSVTFEVDERECDWGGIIGSRRLLGVCGDLTSGSQYLNGNSNVHINDIQTKDFPMKDDCAAEYKIYNGGSVIKSCWKFSDMPHLQKTFPYFDMPTLPYKEYTMPGGEVPTCQHLISGKVSFLQRPCQTPDVEYVWIRPSYKFYPGLSGKAKHAGKCTVVTQPPVTKITEYYTSNDNQDNWPKYESHGITYKPFGNIDASFLTYDNEQGERVGFNFRAFVNFPCEYQKTYFNQFTEAKISTAYDSKFAPVNAETSKTQEICPDYASEACFKNVYAFYGMPCTWVDKKKFLFSVLRGEEYMSNASPDDINTMWASFRSYGSQKFDFDLATFKLQVRRYTAGIPTRLSTTKVQIDDNDVIDIAPEDGHSCDGCVEMPGGQGVKHNTDLDPKNTQKTQYIPLECRLCLQFESIAPGNFANDKKYQRCQECERHAIRSPNPYTPSQCVSCSSINATYPMRVFQKQTQCTTCVHVQHFDATTEEGCSYYVSVSDFITFGADGLPVFTSIDNKSPRDEFSEKGVKPLLVVEPKHYRILNIGTVWTASSNRSVCTYNAEEVINSTTSNLTNATRNTAAKRLYYRKWCGHHEIIRQRNALLRKQQILPVRMNFIIGTLQEIKSNCGGAVTVLKKSEKEVMPDNRVAEFKCENQTHKYLYEIRREGQEVQCRVCAGTSYTKQCWPTYHPSMLTVDDVYFSNTNTPSPGTCETCKQRCDTANYFLNVSLFSCWSNGTERISGGDHGRLDDIQKRASLHMNYWYKDAVCSKCPMLDGVTARRPALVTRCGNKVSFDIWHPSDVIYRDGSAQPTVRVCCSVIRSGSGATFDVNLDAWCVTQQDSGRLECETTIPDLATETQPYCPPGWFVSDTCALQKENIDVWTPKCCTKCEDCSMGRVKTPKYQDCPGDTFYDTQAFGCKAECLSGNYLDGDTCIPCETCMP